MAQTNVVLFLALGLSSDLLMLSHANEFLKVPAHAFIESVSEEDIRVSLLDEVEGSLGKGSASGRLSQMEATLRPIVAALPKNAYGNLERSAVSYALHRLFVLRHGWVIKGLGSEAVLKNSSSPTKVLKDQVPSFIEGLFEQRLAGKGFRLQELAILASTIEHLIHNEAVSRLGAVFNVHKLSVTSPISKAEADDVLNTYMMAYILGENLNNMTLDQALELNKAMPEVFLAWKDTQNFVNGVRKNIIKDEANVDFASLARVVESVGEQYGSFQDFECRQMKETLIKMEYRGTGRVRLADFYKPALDGAWTFQESSSYLRSLGSLDESDPNQPSVMMANYITSHTNCIASSGYYSVCCKNECEGILGHLEEKIGSPEAKPATISALIPTAPSPTVTKLSTSLLQRLDDIAASHGGAVPLHGRLFAQWMHHVYPRECPYPHLSGTTDAQLPDDWMTASGEDSTASQEEMKQHVAHANDPQKFKAVKGDLAVEDLMPWSTEEELIVVNHAGLGGSLHSTDSLSASLRSMVLLAASGSLAVALIQTLSKASPLGMGAPLGDEKYMV